jgi:hypothetical protein
LDYFHQKDYFQISNFLYSFETSKHQKIMASFQHTIVAAEMVWQWYFDQTGTKHVRELLGKEAIKFIEDLRRSDLETKNESTVPKNSKTEN